MFRNLDFKRDLLPHLLAVVFFLALTVAYFTPIFFEDKVLMQYDVQQFQGASKELTDFRQNTGEEALWTNRVFSGMPAYLISTQYSGDLVQHVQRVMMLGLPAVAANLFVTLLCGYILMVVLGMRPLLAVAGAIALGFTSYNLVILEAGHNSKSFAIAFMPLVLAGLILAFRALTWRKMLLGAGVFALGLALQLRVNHVQITYYLGLMMVIYGLIELVYAAKSGTLKLFFTKAALLLAGAILAIGVSFGRLYTTTSYSNYSIRGKSELSANNAGDKKSDGLDRDYAFSYSYGVLESFTLLVPEFYGGASQQELGLKSETGKALSSMGVPENQIKEALANLPMYWGDLPITSGPVYLGAIVVFLFVLGFYLVDKRVRYWLVGATVLSLLLAWGKNFDTFNYLMFDYFPAYNKFRAVSMALVIAQVAVPLLGILALWELIKQPNTPELRKKLLTSAGITLGLCLLAILMGLTFDYVGAQDEQLAKVGFPMEAIRADRASALTSDALRSMFFIALAAGLLFYYLRGKVSRTMALAGVALLILVDLWMVDRRYLSTEKFEKNGVEAYFQPTPADQAILQDKDLGFRVYNASTGITSDGRTSYFHNSIGGYHGAKLRRYQDVIEQHISQGNMRVLNMLNTRYVITKPNEAPQRNPGALGSAWFVEEIKTVANPDEEIAALRDFDPATQAIVDKSKFPVTKTSYSKGQNTIQLTGYQPNHLTYQATVTEPGFVVFSEIYYANGWNAYLNGKPVEHLRVNYILRGMPLPVGTHKIEFKFEPKEYEIGNLVSLLASILLLGFVAAAVVLNVRERGEEKAA